MKKNNEMEYFKMTLLRMLLVSMKHHSSTLQRLRHIRYTLTRILILSKKINEITKLFNIN